MPRTGGPALRSSKLTGRLTRPFRILLMRTLPRRDRKSAADIPDCELPGGFLVGRTCRKPDRNHAY